MNKSQRLLDTIGSCNGEIRLMQARYEHPGWYCMIAIQELHGDEWEKFEDLVGGDNDFFEAREYLFSSNGNFVCVIAPSPEQAMSDALDQAEKKLNELLDAN